MDAIEMQRRLVEHHFALLCDHDWEGAVNAFTGPAPAFDDVPANLRFTGKSGIAAAYSELANALPDLRIEVSHVTDVLACSIREFLIIGTHLGDYQGLKATGRPVNFACAQFFFFDAVGRLNSVRAYYDSATILRQMRGDVQPYLPKALRVAA